jgi:predicted TIM-barrel fold metal-dependent hydrolase
MHDLARQVTFGSDYPSIPHPYATQVRALARLSLDDEGLVDVLAGNARRLLARRTA